MPFGWQGGKVRLAPLDKDKHFDNAIAWFNDPDTTHFMLTGDLPITRLVEEEFFTRAMNPGPNMVIFAIETLDAEHIGFTGLDKIEWQHRTAMSGTTIGLPEYRGQGYGTDTIRVRTRYAFDVLNLRLLLTEVMDENVASRKALEKAGYKPIGHIPARYWRRGAYQDVTLLGLNRDDWTP